MQVQVSSVVFGSLTQELSLPPVTLSLVSERVTVAELIKRTVRKQINTLVEEELVASQTVRKILERQYLTEADVARQACEGRIRFNDSLQEKYTSIDIDREIIRAYRGFEFGAFKVVVDGEMMDDLEDVVTLTPYGKVTFLRLVPLVGG